jgi:hypothetical protein
MPLGIGAVVLGVAVAPVGAAAVGLGWWVAAKEEGRDVGHRAVSGKRPAAPALANGIG